MKIIDVHAHTGKFNWPIDEGNENIPEIAKRNNIEKMVLSSARSLLDDLELGNEENYQFCQEHDFAYMYIVLNPHRYKECLSEINKYVEKPKVVGFKLHPEQFDDAVNSKLHRRLFYEIDPFGLPILIHTGHLDNQAPFTVRDVAREFTNSKYIMAHMGSKWWQQTIPTMEECPNTYVDIVTSWLEVGMIETLCRTVGSHRILYGSDLLLLEPTFTIGCVLTADILEQEKENIFYHNANNLFKFRH